MSLSKMIKRASVATFVTGLAASISFAAVTEMKGAQLALAKQALAVELGKISATCDYSGFRSTLNSESFNKVDSIQVDSENSRRLVLEENILDEKSGEIKIRIRRVVKLGSDRKKIVDIKEFLYHRQAVNNGTVVAPNLSEELVLVDIRECNVKQRN